MTSVLNVDTIAAKDGTSPVALTKQHAAKVWLRSTDAAVLTQSFNVSSGTDNGTGNYTYAFTNSFNYSADHGGIGAMAGPDNAYFRKNANDGAAGSLQVRGVTSDPQAGIDTECSLNIHGDLA